MARRRTRLLIGWLRKLLLRRRVGVLLARGSGVLMTERKPMSSTDAGPNPVAPVAVLQLWLAGRDALRDRSKLRRVGNNKALFC